LRSRLDATADKRHIVGDHNVTARHACNDPVVRGIGFAADDHAFYEFRTRHDDKAVREDERLHSVTLGDPIDLVPNRAGVGIDMIRIGFAASLISPRTQNRSA
jgi:hypothetical protein